MRSILYAFVLLVLCCCMNACGDSEDQYAQPKEDLKNAMDLYYRNSLDSFYMYLDFGEELDTVQRTIIMASYRLHLAQVNNEFQGVKSIEPKLVRVESDTVVYVVYDLVYGNRQRETSSQKMIKEGDNWKLRIRN